MSNGTYIALANFTVSGTAPSTLTFSSIPATYRDLVLVANFQMSGTNSATRLRLNGDTGANYSGVWMVGITNTVGGLNPGGHSSSETGESGARVFGAANGPVNLFTNIGMIYIMDYSATDKHKTILSRYGSASTNRDVQATASRWANTNAVTSITLYDVSSQTYQAGSTFTLFGIRS